MNVKTAISCYIFVCMYLYHVHVSGNDSLAISPLICRVEVSKYHISMEIWVDLYPLAWQSLQDKYPNVAAKNLGNMGYDGVVSAFIPKPVQKEAYKTEGVALQYFRNWNASWYQPSKYFDSISMISTALIRPVGGHCY